MLNAKGVWYTQVSGIWQTVWLEEVASDHISHLKITTDADTETITVKPTIQGTGTIQVAVKDGENTVAIATGDDEISLKIPDAKLWSPPSPHLYDIEVTLVDASGATLDEVKSYTGIRTGAN